MKNFIFAALLFAAFQPQAQTAQFTANKVVSIPSNYSTKIFTLTVSSEDLNPSLTLPYNCEVIHGNQSNRTIIEISISANVKPSILNALVLANRYVIDTNTLTFPNLKPCFVGGVQLDEVIKVKIYTK